ncbi:MAG: hypothetical protein HY698_20710 [Deltaproteobacteria bacterium]|nr:hypothetical protein [Deltaproteobacteria bacterium]
MTGNTRSWVDTEPGLREVWSELSRLFGRARSRPGWTIGLAILFGLLVVGMKARKAPMFPARVVFRVTEGDIKLGQPPPTRRQLREHVFNIALSYARLIEVCRKHSLYAQFLSKHPTVAVDSLRRDLDVSVNRNYFLYERGSQDPPRTARFSITYRHKDPQVALAVVKHVGQIIVDHESTSRKAMSRATAERAAFEIKAAEAELERKRRELAEVQVALAQAPPQEAGALAISASQVQESITIAEGRLNVARRRQTEAELGADAESNALGMSFELVDWGTSPGPGRSRAMALILLGLAAFLVALPFCGLAMSAFDQRVYNVKDIQRLGIKPLGHVPPFSGDQVGSLRHRLGQSSTLRNQ